MKNNGNLVETLVKAGIVAAGTGIGILLSKCVSVSKNDESEVEIIPAEDADVDPISVDETVTDEGM